MRASLTTVICLSAAMGCTTVQDSFHEELPADGLRRVEASIERGDLSLTGGSTASISIDGESWGRASQLEKAESRQAGNAWDASLRGWSLVLTGTSATSGAGIDFEVALPRDVSTNISVDRGTVSLDGLVGRAEVSAGRIVVVDHAGPLDLQADGDIEVSAFPIDGEELLLQSGSGDVELTLPYGTDVDLLVYFDPEEQQAIGDLGYWAVEEGEGWFHATSGRGTVPVEVVVEDGSFTLTPAW
jgi:hypothetical protein